MRSRWPVVAYTAIAAATGLLLLAAFSPSRGSQPSPASYSAQQQRSRLDVSHLPSFGARSISAAPADGCKPRQLFSAAEQRARREYQQFLLEDAKRFEAPMLTWAGYSGPWIENTFLEYWKQQFAAGVDMGDRIYLPVQWIDCYFKCEKPRKVQMLQYLATLKPEYTYFSVYMMDKGMVIAGMVMPPWLDLMLFSACATTKGVRTVPIPLLKVVLEPQGLSKDTQVNFLGDLTSHRLREEMAEILKPQGYLIGKARHEEIFGIIERSNFTLTPRGHGSASWRMYEALQLGSIPIYIWSYDPLVPYTELLNWNEMAIMVHRKEIRFIPHLIKLFNVTRGQQLLAANRHLWTYEYVHQYIVDRLRREPCFPVPFSVWQDRWGWEQG